MMANEIAGWMSAIELAWLAEQAASHKWIVEVGCYKGRSTVALAEATAGKVYAIDPWSGPYFRDDGSVAFQVGDAIYREFLTNVQPFILAGTVKVHRGTFQSWPYRPVDMVFLDGDHRYETVVKDLDTAALALCPGGLLCGHDYTHADWPGVRWAVDERFPQVEIVDSIWAVTV